mmetsp:Transcript_21042/g.41699  ORF Transcript_21042/g.41699 Transcript_21042/m.41699 type:complete len:456 (+) Transcript_21042:54-1421(+)
MGIHGLMSLIQDEAPGALKEQDIKAFTGRKVAIDASMAMYQFIIAVRSAEQATGQASMLTNDAGETTSHIQGIFNRTIRMMTNGLKPCYVFDGKPPALKSGELAKRTKARTKASEELKAAEERDDVDAVNKFSSRLVKVTRQHNEDAKTLLRLMGVPVVEAPGEAEAQCAVLAKAGSVFATGTEDMDALTFATPYLLKKLTFSAGSGGGTPQPIQQLCYDKLLEGLGLTGAQFIDLCILCGCDYCDKIPGIGPKTALKMLKKHGNIEELVKHLDLSKHPLPSGFEHPEAAKARREKAAKEEAKHVKKNAQDGFTFNNSTTETAISVSAPLPSAVKSGEGDAEGAAEADGDDEVKGEDDDDDDEVKGFKASAVGSGDEGLEDSDDEITKEGKAEKVGAADKKDVEESGGGGGGMEDDVEENAGEDNDKTGKEDAVGAESSPSSSSSSSSASGTTAH